MKRFLDDSFNQFFVAAETGKTFVTGDNFPVQDAQISILSKQQRRKNHSPPFSL